MSIEMTALSLRLLTIEECKNAMMAHDTHIVEWETVNYTFVTSPSNLAIVRTAALGGDTGEIHGGWLYATPFGMMKEWAEIRQMAVAFTPYKRNAPPIIRPNN